MVGVVEGWPLAGENSPPAPPRKREVDDKTRP